jgi:hypothetical protein
MKSFIFYPLILSLFLIIPTSYAQDFLDDLYISNNNYTPSYFDENNDVLIDSIGTDDYVDYDYDYDYDYEDRILKFHNPNYGFRYCWNYGWNDPYWSHSWYSPSWSLSYYNYGYNTGWGFGYGNYSGWGHNWHNPYWGYGFHHPYAYHYPSYYNYYGMNSWNNNPFFVYNSNNYFGHLYSHDTNIRPKTNTSSRITHNKDHVQKDRITNNSNILPITSEKPKINNNRITKVTSEKPKINNNQHIKNQNSNISNLNTRDRTNTKKPKNNIVNQIANELINNKRNNKSNYNRNSKSNSNRSNNFNSNNNRSSQSSKSGRRK